MEDKEKKTVPGRVETFFAGKGFYIVLLLCVAVIGVSAWSMLSGGGMKERTDSLSLQVSEAGQEAVAAGKTAPALVTEQPAAAGASEKPSEPTTKQDRTEDVEAEPLPDTSQAAETQSASPAPGEAAAAEPAAAEETVSTGSDYFIWPVSGTVENGYSMTALVYDRTMQDWRTHDGLDIAAEIGTQVRAAAAGKVTEVYYDQRLGTTVVMQHKNGLGSIYANLAGTPAVSVGDQVGVGQILGAVGDTALSEIGEVAHLHFAMTSDGINVDPTDYLP